LSCVREALKRGWSVELWAFKNGEVHCFTVDRTRWLIYLTSRCQAFLDLGLTPPNENDGLRRESLCFGHWIIGLTS
jgi:hypothetical protein